jgi:hypothetical protein
MGEEPIPALPAIGKGDILILCAFGILKERV